MKVDSLVRQRFRNLLKIMLTTENFILMAYCELEKENLTIINIQRIAHAFDRTFENLINQIFVGRMQMQMLECWKD